MLCYETSNIMHFFQGYTRFQLKLGGDPHEDIERIHVCHAVLSPGDVLIGDANTGKLKAMKSSPLLGPFCGSEFWGFFLLKI